MNTAAPAQTPRLSEHARLRCAQMGVPTKTVKRIVANPDLTYDSHGCYQVATAALDPRLRVVYRCGETAPLIVTVLWRTQDTYTRPDGRPEPAQEGLL